MSKGLTDIENLKVTYFALQKRQLMVHSPEHVTAYNRLHDRVWLALLAIEGLGEAGRRAIEDMLTHDVPMIRFRAATRVLAWNPHLAVPVLGRLLTDEFPPHAQGYRQFAVVAEVNLFLHKHFDVRFYDGTELTEPMRAYGYELPEEYILRNSR